MRWFAGCNWYGIPVTLLALLILFLATFGSIPLSFAASHTAALEGFYFGAHVGLGRGDANATVWDPVPASVNNTFGGPIGGAQFGYNVVLPSGVLLGWEIDASFPNYIASNATIAAIATTQNHVTEELDYVTTARIRVGRGFGPWLFYGTGGFAFMGGRFLNELPSGDEEIKLRTRFGGVVGAGAEYAFDTDWSVRLEYLYGNFGKANVGFSSGASYASTADFNML